MRVWRLGWLLALAGLSGCAGVPGLYKPALVNPDTTLAPKVDHIVEQISCELKLVSRSRQLGSNYLITAFLTLQVDDDINFTPSISAINPLSIPQTNSTFTEALAIGGSRRRTFTSTFYFDSAKLAEQPECTSNSDRLYRLDGDLGIREIVRDGVGLLGKTQVVKHDGEKSLPVFGSLVQFIVTRNVTALGPTWTLVHFKGPGSANGLFNGKALNTDSLVLTFAPQNVETSARADEANKAAAAKSADSAAVRSRFQVAAREASLAQANADEVTRQESAVFGSPRFTARARTQSRLRIQAAERRPAAPSAGLQLIAAEQGRVDAELAEARRRADAAAVAVDTSRADAATAGQGLLNTIILQNLNIAPR